MPEFRYAVETMNQSPEWFQRFVYGGPAPYDVTPGLSASQVRVVSLRPIDFRTERWNGEFVTTNCTRPATLQERRAFDGDLSRSVTLEAFFDLFTKLERIAVRQAIRGNCAAVPPVLPDEDLEDAVQRLERRAQARGGIVLASAWIGALLDLLVSKGLLTVERKAEIQAGTEPV